MDHMEQMSLPFMDMSKLKFEAALDVQPSTNEEKDREHMKSMSSPFFNGIVPKYTVHPLNEVYGDALAQVEQGKGAERHGADNKGFYDQQWVEVARRHGLGFLTGQAVKKANEAALMKSTMPQEQWEREMLGAINYLAMAVLYNRRYNNDNT